MLKDNLPKFISEDNNQVKDVLEAIQPELDALRSEVKSINDEIFAITTTTQIARWERDYSIPLNENLTLEQRREILLSKVRRGKVLTKDGLNALIEVTIGSKAFSVSNSPEQYYFKIYIQDIEKYNILNDVIYRARPAHLIYDIIEIIYVRRCGTFACGTNPL